MRGGSTLAVTGQKIPPMLICQAIEHDLLLVTDDETIRRYPIKTAWVVDA